MVSFGIKIRESSEFLKVSGIKHLSPEPNSAIIHDNFGGLQPEDVFEKIVCF